jgi:hypothetical protein
VDVVTAVDDAMTALVGTMNGVTAAVMPFFGVVIGDW